MQRLTPAPAPVANALPVLAAPVAPPVPGAPAGPVPVAAPAAPPGWYTDPSDPAKHRYWDGAAWRDGTAPASHAAPKKRLSRGKIAAIVGGSAAVFVLVVAAIAVVLPRLEDAALSAAGGGFTGRALETEVPAGWTSLPIMNGAATIEYDPDWEDVSEYMGAADLERLMSEEAGMDVSVDGMWLTSGDLWNGGSSVMVMSVADAGAPLSAQLEARGYMIGARAELDGTTTTSEGAIHTASGHEGYVIEYESPYYGEIMPGAVGILVEDSRELIVVTSGTATTGSDIENLEAVLNSLSFG